MILRPFAILLSLSLMVDSLRGFSTTSTPVLSVERLHTEALQVRSRFTPHEFSREPTGTLYGEINTMRLQDEETLRFNVFLPTPLQNLAGTRSEVRVALPPKQATIRNILLGLTENYPDLQPFIFDSEGAVRKWAIYLGETRVKALAYDTTLLEDGARVTLAPAIAGGSDRDRKPTAEMSFKQLQSIAANAHSIDTLRDIAAVLKERGWHDASASTWKSLLEKAFDIDSEPQQIFEILCNMNGVPVHFLGECISNIFSRWLVPYGLDSALHFEIVDMLKKLGVHKDLENAWKMALGVGIKTETPLSRQTVVGTFEIFMTLENVGVTFFASRATHFLKKIVPPEFNFDYVVAQRILRILAAYLRDRPWHEEYKPIWSALIKTAIARELEIVRIDAFRILISQKSVPADFIAQQTRYWVTKYRNKFDAYAQWVLERTMLKLLHHRGIDAAVWPLWDYCYGKNTRGDAARVYAALQTRDSVPETPEGYIALLRSASGFSVDFLNALSDRMFTFRWEPTHGPQIQKEFAQWLGEYGWKDGIQKAWINILRDANSAYISSTLDALDFLSTLPGIPLKFVARAFNGSVPWWIHHTKHEELHPRAMALLTRLGWHRDLAPAWEMLLAEQGAPPRESFGLEAICDTLETLGGLAGVPLPYFAKRLFQFMKTTKGWVASVANRRKARGLSILLLQPLPWNNHTRPLWDRLLELPKNPYEVFAEFYLEAYIALGQNSAIPVHFFYSNLERVLRFLYPHFLERRMSIAQRVAMAQCLSSQAKRIQANAEALSPAFRALLADTLALLGPDVGSHLDAMIRAARNVSILTNPEANRIMTAQVRRLRTCERIKILLGYSPTGRFF